MGDAACMADAEYSLDILSENLLTRNHTGDLLSVQGQQ
jgi:hypothetical protein